MRTREEIEEDSMDVGDTRDAETIDYVDANLSAILETLLDIRDLLTPPGDSLK